MTTLPTNTDLTTAQRNKMAQEQINSITKYIEVLDALPTKDLFVQQLGSFFVQHTDDVMGVGGIQHATTYTLEQLDSMAAHGVGVPPYYNGNGEKSVFMSMKDGVRRAKDMQLDTILVYVDIMRK